MTPARTEELRSEAILLQEQAALIEEEIEEPLCERETVSAPVSIVLQLGGKIFIN